jgi:hypothetical protein
MRQYGQLKIQYCVPKWVHNIAGIFWEGIKTSFFWFKKTGREEGATCPAGPDGEKPNFKRNHKSGRAERHESSVPPASEEGD